MTRENAARECLGKRLSELYYGASLEYLGEDGVVKLMADFADKAVADAVRERDEMLNEVREIVFLSDGSIYQSRDEPGLWLAEGEPFTEHESPLKAYRALKSEKEGE